MNRVGTRGPVPQAPEVRFWRRVQVTDTCWQWTGSLVNQGYGRIDLDSRTRRYMLAHRFAYEMLVGPIPAGLHIDHLCSNRGCVNPAHLEPVTNEENGHRTGERRTQCSKGHPYTQAVLLGGKRACGPCWRAYHAQYERDRRRLARETRVAA